MGEVRAATERSIAAAVRSGALDSELSAGPIATLMLVCDALDDPDFPVVDGRFDNVSVSAYLKYAAELRLTPASAAEVKEKAGGKLAQLRSIEGARGRKASGS